MTRRPTGGLRGGPGSNQYQTKPGGDPPTRPDPTGISEAVTADPDPELVAAAFQPGGLALWQSWCARDDEILTWLRSGHYDPREAAMWLAVRPDFTPAVADEFTEAGKWSSAAVIEKYGLTDWAATSIPTVELPQWAHGFSGHPMHHSQNGLAGYAAEQWRDAGWSAEDAAVQFRDGFPTPQDRDWWLAKVSVVKPRARMWRAYQVGPDEIALPGNLRDEEEGNTLWATLWEARVWGLNDPADAREWRDAAMAQMPWGDDRKTRFFPSTAAYCAQAGVPAAYARETADAEQALWKQHIYPADRKKHPSMLSGRTIAAMWQDHPDDPTEAVRRFHGRWRFVWAPTTWDAEGFTPDEAKEWIYAGCASSRTGAPQAAFWRDRGLSPDEAGRWIDDHQFGYTMTSNTWVSRFADLIRVRGGNRRDLEGLLRVCVNEFSLT